MIEAFEIAYSRDDFLGTKEVLALFPLSAWAASTIRRADGAPGYVQVIDGHPVGYWRQDEILFLDNPIPVPV